MDGSAPAHLPTSAYLLRSLDEEHGFVPMEVEGRLPEGLDGTLYRVGPGLLDSVGVKVTHLFEADGAVTAIRLGDGKAEAAVRIVQSRGLADERAAGVPLYGPRASYPRRLASALRGRSKNTANTAPMLFQDRLFALMEAAKPTEIDPDTLATLGESTLGGVVRSAFSAHPHRVASRKAQYNFGVRYGKTTMLDVFELPDVGAPRRLTSLPLAKPVMLHDFIATRDKLIFFVAPFEVVLARALLMVGGFSDLFTWRPEHGTEVIVVPIDTPDQPVRFGVPAFYQWHFANAFDDGQACLVDFVRYRDASSFHQLADVGEGAPLGGELVRVRVESARAAVTTESTFSGPCEFPSVDARVAGERHRYVFTNSESATTRGIARHDLESGKATQFAEGLHTWYAEPVFVPRAGGTEGQGHLLSVVLDARKARTHVAVFDAEHVGDGPVAKAYFHRPMPITFHGLFRPAPSVG